MDGLNQFIVSRVLGSTMKFATRPTFGPLGALSVQNQILANWPKRGEQISFTPPTDKQIARAFEETRRGLPIDRFLADPDMAAAFFNRCRQLDVLAPDHALALRLFQFRKSPKKLVRLAKPTAKEPRRDYSAYQYAAEMASIQIKYRYGASVDDILAYPDIGGEFDRLAAQLHPGRTPLEYRLAALHVRKSRYCRAEQRTLFDSIKASKAEKAKKDLGTLDRIDIEKIGHSDAIFGLVEESRVSRFLYISQAKDLGQAVYPFTRPELYRALGNSFWSPSLSCIRLMVYDIHRRFHDVSASLWAKKLIQDKSPIFNAPINLAA